jgi:hypothetical protein
MRQKVAAMLPDFAATSLKSSRDRIMCQSGTICLPVPVDCCFTELAL